MPAALWAVVLLAACGAPPPASAPPSGEVAVIEANRRAGAYLRSGDLTRKTEDLQFALLNKLEFLFN